MAEVLKFQRHQFEFTAHIRDPGENPPPAGIEDRRMEIYRGLFFNNVQQLLGRTFPVLKRILGDEGWTALTRDYFKRHESHTPLFLEMPREFLNYLENERGDVAGDPPFMLELAHYEWVELALSIDDRPAADVDVDAEGDLLDGVPVVSTLAWSLAYRFPVHAISPRFRPEAPGEEPTRLVVYRDAAQKVGFMEINVVTARLLELLNDAEPRTGRAALNQIADEMNHPAPQTVINSGLEILAGLRARDIVLGTQRSDTD